MMKKALEVIKEILMTFGILIVIFAILSAVLGLKAQEASSLFAFGNKALSVETVFQLLGLSAAVNVLKSLFSSNFMIRRMSRTLRHIVLFILIFILLVAMILAFNWFQTQSPLPWILTAVAFIISFTVSVFIIEYRQKKDDRSLQDALNQWK